MQWLTWTAIILCGFNAVTGLLAWFAGDSFLGQVWGPKWYMPFGWLPMSLFCGFNLALL